MHALLQSHTTVCLKASRAKSPTPRVASALPLKSAPPMASHPASLLQCCSVSGADAAHNLDFRRISAGKQQHQRIEQTRTALALPFEIAKPKSATQKALPSSLHKCQHPQLINKRNDYFLWDAKRPMCAEGSPFLKILYFGLAPSIACLRAVNIFYCNLRETGLSNLNGKNFNRH
jgi:hypothetical protein